MIMFAAGVVGTWLTWRYFVQTTAGQRLDATAFQGSEIGRNTLWRAAEPVLDIVSVPFIVIVIGAAALIAIVRRRWLLAVQVAVLVGGANITTQLLKHAVLDRPELTDDIGPGWNSLPSGHTTVAMSVAAALVLVVPRRIRPVVAIFAAGYAALTGISTMIGGWHRPSDVVAAIAVVLAWAGLTTTLTAFGSSERVSGPDAGAAETKIISVILLLTTAGAGAAAASSLLRTRDRLLADSSLTNRSDLATAYLGAALGVVATAALAFAIILVAHQLASRPDPARTEESRSAEPV